jgi:uncharacterized Rmd1/YagE family protein
MLDSASLSPVLRKELTEGRAFVYANGCVVTAGLKPQDTQDLLLWLAQNIPRVNFENMVVSREMRMVPDASLGAQARALSSSVVLDALEQTAGSLFDSAERDLLQPRPLPGRYARRQRWLARVAAFRYECVHGQGVLDRPDTKWNLRHQAAYRQLARELQLDRRTAVLSHKLDELENLLRSALESGRNSGMLRSLWAEVWLLALFPLGRILAMLLARQIGIVWLQRWLDSLHLF